MKELKVKYEYKKFDKCLMCGKKLKKEKSKLIGYGPNCYKKYIEELNNKNKVRRLF